jgi:CBS domain-containing membrane protein
MACAALVPDLALASALAVALSVAIMVPLRCLHPPGAALALLLCSSTSMVLRWQHFRCYLIPSCY